MKTNYIKRNYYLIPLATLLTITFRGYLATLNKDWLETLSFPSAFPPFWAFPSIIWPLIFTSITITVLFIWNKTKRDIRYGYVMPLVIIMALLHVAWSIVFFELHNIKLGFIILLILTTLSVKFMQSIAKESIATSLLFAPFVAWQIYASILTYSLVQLNS